MQTCDPLEARQRFKSQIITNWVICFAIFVPLVFVLQKVFPFLIADFIAVAFVFCLFFYFLRTRTTIIMCPSCGKPIATNTVWECGACGKINWRVYDFPFIHRCESPSCGCAPKAYKCHHRGCGTLIFLSPDQSELNYARCHNAHEKPAPVAKPRSKQPTAQDQFAHEVEKREKNIKLKTLDVKEAVLDIELQNLNRTLKPENPKTLKDRLRSGVFSKTELENEVRKMKAEADKEFADDEDARRRRHAVIDAEARELL